MASFDDIFGPVGDPGHMRAEHESISQEMANRDARLQAQVQARGGNARSRHRLTTHGVGNSTKPVRLDFAVTFVEEPLVYTGVVMRQHAVDFGALPLTTVSVFNYVRDTRGLYVAANVLVAVGIARDASDYQALNATTRAYVLEHNVVFEGSAIRDVSYDAITDDL